MMRRRELRTVGRLRLLVVFAAVTAMAFATPAFAGAWGKVIVLTGASSAEGIASGRGATFYAGDAFKGDIYRGDFQTGTASLFIDVPDGRNALGMTFDSATGYLFVAGGFTGQGYVYDTATGATVASYQFVDPSTNPVINDVTLTPAGAYFTNSSAPQLFFVPFSGGVPGPFQTITVTGPAGDLSGQFNLNGIVSTPDGRIIVAHSGDGALYTVDPTTGASELVAGVSVPNVDGIVLLGRRLWAIQNFSNQISVVKLSPDLSSGTVERTITNDNFEIPTTGALFGDTLGVVQAKFDTGFPPTASEYDVVTVRK